LDVVPDSALPISRQQEQQMSQQMFQMFKGDPMIKQRELYVRVMNVFKDLIPDPDQLLEDPQVVQQKQQAMQQQAQRGAGRGR